MGESPGASTNALPAAEPIFRQAVEAGVTFWDTANVYGHGSSEEIVGMAVPLQTSWQAGCEGMIGG
jgi:aryl-alcohol dehydrogenase-like predicted oxidoreductase